VAVYHCCPKANIIARDTYFLMKHIVYQLCRLPQIQGYLHLRERVEFYEYLDPNFEPFQIQAATEFISFLKAVNHLQLNDS